MSDIKKKIIIVGAGFGGIELAKSLRKGPYSIWLVDKNNYHTFQPLLYQVATGGLEADSIAYPVRRIFRGVENVQFRRAEVSRIDVEQRTLKTSLGMMSFDFLVLASGSTNNFFNFEPKKGELLSLKSVADALDIRSYLMQNLEQAIATFDQNERNELLNVAIIGGGPAGIELAGALAEMRRYVLPRDFPQIDFTKMSISLFEASTELLANMSDNASHYSLEYLKSMGVNVMLNSKVKDIDASHVYLEDGTEFLTDTIIWTAGVKGNPIEGMGQEKIIAGNRIAVNTFNQVTDMPNIFAIGDVACCIDAHNPKGLPMLASVAIQQARRLSKNLLLIHSDQPMLPFTYKNRGVMATIGRNKAVVDLPRYKFQGMLAWFLWMFIHIMSLVGFRNRLVTFINWAGSYFRYDRPLGLIIRPFNKSARKK